MSKSGLWLSSMGTSLASKTTPESLAFLTGDTLKSFTVTGNYKVTRIILVMPTFSGAVVTGVLSIENSDSVEIYSSSAASETNTHVYSPDPGVPLVGVNTFKLTLSTDPLSSGTPTVSLYLEEG